MSDCRKDNGAYQFDDLSGGIERKSAQCNEREDKLQKESIEDAVLRNLERYFENLQGSQPHPLHPMMIAAVEKPLLKFAMDYTGDNKCEAAQLLGINRNTLHKKLKMYDIQPSKKARDELH